MADPFGSRITLVRGFLQIPVLKGVITILILPSAIAWDGCWCFWRG
jgi:hypothetical protein